MVMRDDLAAANAGADADAEQVTTWPSGVRIRPTATGDPEVLEVVDTVAGTTSLVQVADLARAIRDGGLVGIDQTGSATPDEVREAFERDLVHWQRRGWHPSDQFYVASTHASPARRPADNRGHGYGAALRDELSRGSDGVHLGEPMEPRPAQVAEQLVTRRSGRAYVNAAVPLERLSGFLRFGLGDRRPPDSTYGIDDQTQRAWVYTLCVYDVEGVEAGTYLVDLESATLIPRRRGSFRDEMCGVMQGMHSPATAAWTLGLVADFEVAQAEVPGEMGLRRLYLEAGVIAQDLILLGMSYGLTTLVTPAQKDSEFLALHDLTADTHGPVYTLTMGLSRGERGAFFDGVDPREALERRA